VRQTACLQALPVGGMIDFPQPREGYPVVSLGRREFVALLGGAAACPLAARAQQATKLPRIGFLGVSTPSGWRNYVTAFEQRLRELGWIEGRTVAIEMRWAEGRGERFEEIAAEFVRTKVDVIVTGGGAVLAAKQATSIVPIVFALAIDPVGIGLVASLARPGGNVTGLSQQATDLVGKRLDLLRAFIPGLGRLAILGNAEYPAAVLEMDEVQEAAHKLGLDTSILEIRHPEDIDTVFDAFRGRAQALYVVADPLTGSNRARVNTAALNARLPTMHGIREYTETGGLISYGPSISDLFRRAAEFVDKILRGARPADLPVEQPTKFDLVINTKTARALSLEIPPTLLALADEVIE
jgi:putative tryptophan/tyrosine transport system substrate-binding protein